MSVRARVMMLALGCALTSGTKALAAQMPGSVHGEQRALADNRLQWPTSDQVDRVLMLRDYNTRVVLLGTTLLGVSAGAVGAFMLLRKQSLVGDVVSHAALPGIAVAFIFLEWYRPGAGRSLPALLSGAAVAGLLGVLCTMAIRRWTRIKEDAALAIVLSVFFGLGIALFTIIQSIPSGNAAGLHHFIFGKAASMVAGDVELIAWGALAALLLCGSLFKEFALLCFDTDFAATQGWPVFRLDLMLMGLVVGVTVIGLQSVGLLLVVAMLILPAAAARFWTDSLLWMVVVAAALGGASAYGGVVASALFPRLSAGAIIVLTAAAFFTGSLLFGWRHGVLKRLITQSRVAQRIGRHDLLRALFEHLESASGGPPIGHHDLMDMRVAPDQLLAMRSWTRARLQSLAKQAHRDNLVLIDPDGRLRLTGLGVREAKRIVRNHRLWELYLIHYAHIAPSHVDRDADLIEHVLDPEMVSELEDLLARQVPTSLPPSPHRVEQLNAG